MITKLDQRRLADGKRTLELPDPISVAELEHQIEQIGNAVRALQSLDDLGPEANTRAWQYLQELTKRASGLRLRLEEEST